MKKLCFLLLIVSFFACNDSEDCNCEAYEIIDVNGSSQERFIKSFNNSCDSLINKDPNYIYKDVNC